MNYTLWNEECLSAMKRIPDGSVDMVLCDLPYGTTACKWDTVIPFEPLWAAYRRVCKKNAAIVLTASQPFTSALVMSNVREFRHAWVWNKKFAGNVMQAKRQPLKTVEDVLVFSTGDKGPKYFPQMEKRDTPIKAGGLNSNGAIPNMSGEEARQAIKKKIYDEKYPTSIQTHNVREGRGLHPTQKPVALMEYLIKTYTNPGELVLDNTMGSGTTGVACGNLGRRFIGIERDEIYFKIAQARISSAYPNDDFC
jgi:site-specific DNA-methyltransferase (adenine-specific)